MFARVLTLLCVVFMGGCAFLTPAPAPPGYIEVQLLEVVERPSEVLLRVHLEPQGIAPGTRVFGLSLAGILCHYLHFYDDAHEPLLLLDPGDWSEFNPGPFESTMIRADEPVDLVLGGHSNRTLRYIGREKAWTQPASGSRLRYGVYSVVLSDRGEARSAKELEQEVTVRGGGMTVYTREE